MNAWKSPVVTELEYIAAAQLGQRARHHDDELAPGAALCATASGTCMKL